MNKKHFGKFFSCIFAITLLVTSAARAAPMFDIIVLMDGSGSITNNDYELQKSALSHLFGSFTIGATDNQFGLIEYSTAVQPQIGLSGSGLDLGNALASTFQSFGQTNIGGAFAGAGDELDANARGGLVQRVVLLLTDGETNESSGLPINPVSYAFNEADNLKNNDALIFTLGFGASVNTDNLLGFSSGADFSYLAADFGGGIAAIDEIVLQLNSLSGPASSVDAPPAIYLLSMGLAGLAWRRRRRVV